MIATPDKAGYLTRFLASLLIVSVCAAPLLVWNLGSALISPWWWLLTLAEHVLPHFDPPLIIIAIATPTVLAAAARRRLATIIVIAWFVANSLTLLVALATFSFAPAG